MQDRAGDGAAERREQEEAGVGDGSRIVEIPAQRRGLLPDAGELLEAVDAASGHGVQRAGRDEVAPDAARAEVAREVATDGLERRLRDARPVVGRPGSRCVEVQADDGAAVALK